MNGGLHFSDGEGLPGRAKLEPYIFGRSSNNATPLFQKIICHHMSPDLPVVIDKKNIDNKSVEEYARYFKNVFNIDKEKFDQLSNYKYLIKSYFSVGFMPSSLNKIVVLTIDSIDENLFYDFEQLKEIFKNPYYQEISIQRILKKRNLEEFQKLSLTNPVRVEELLVIFEHFFSLIHHVLYGDILHSK